MKRHQQDQQQHQHAGQNSRASAQAPAGPAAAASEPPLQFDSNMDWPASSEARDPLPFPTAHIAPCARITTRIYHPPHLTQAGLISGLGSSGNMYTQQAQQGRVETVRDVLVEIAGPSRDEMGRPIIPTQPHVPTSSQSGNTTGPQQQQRAIAQRIGGKTTINNNAATGGSTTTAIDADDGAGFTGAGGFLLGGMANAVSVTGHNSAGNLMAGGAATMGGGSASGAGGGGGVGGMDDDDSMSSGWSTSDSEMSYDNSGGAGGGRGGGGPTRPNPAFGGGGGGGTVGDSAGTSHHHHQHQGYQPPQRAYLLQRTLREAIYGRVRYGIVLKRRQLPPDYDATTSQPMAEWEVTNERCAIKEMSWQHIRKERNRLAEDPIKEVSAMQYLKRYLAQCNGSATSLDSSDAMLSTHLMLPLDLLSDDRYLYSVMPYCDGGELFDRLDQRQKFSEDEARYWMHQILDGVDNLQRAGICHRDMSLENLLVHKDRICLVIDMGMCLRIPYEGGRDDASDLFDAAGSGGGGGGGDNNDEDGDDDSKRSRALSTGADLRTSFMSMDLDNGAAGGANGGANGAAANGTASAGTEKKCCPDIRQRKRYLIKPQGTCGKWHYMTSEIMKNQDPFDGHSVDIWALGVILFLMLTGFPPWERACRTDERFKFMSAGYLVQMLTEWELGLSPDAMDLLQRMVWIDPRDRLSLRQVRNHPWMLAK